MKKKLFSILLAVIMAVTPFYALSTDAGAYVYGDDVYEPQANDDGLFFEPIRDKYEADELAAREESPYDCMTEFTVESIASPDEVCYVVEKSDLDHIMGEEFSRVAMQYYYTRRYDDSFDDTIAETLRKYEHLDKADKFLFDDELFEEADLGAMEDYYHEKYGDEYESVLKLKRDMTRRTSSPERLEFPEPEDAEPESGLAAVGASSITWSVSGTTLYINGSGPMPDYKVNYTLSGHTADAPWMKSYQNTITRIVISSGITSIGKQAFFEMNNLESVSMPSTLTMIGREAFRYCHNIGYVDLPAGLTYISQNAFAGCYKLEINGIPDGVTYIGDDAFFDCNKLDIDRIPDSVEYLGSGSFSSCDIKSITIPDGYEVIREYTFSGCTHMTECNLPDSIISIEKSAFRNCNQYTIDLPPNLEYIGEYALSFCKAGDTLIIPDKVTDIGDYAFERIKSGREVYIGKSVRAIGINPFYRAEIQTFTVSPENTYCRVGNNALIDGENNLVSYPMQAPEKKYAIADGVTSVGKQAFERCKTISEISFPSSLVSIEDQAFYVMDLDKINFNEGLKEIGKNAFWHSISFYKKDMILPDSVNRVGDYAFNWCDITGKVYLSAGFDSLGKSAFDSEVGEFIVPESNKYFKSIDGTLFSKDGKKLIKYSNDSTAESYAVPEGVEIIEDSAFMNARYLKTVTFPDSLRIIGSNAFYGVPLEGKLVIPDGVTEICFDAFYDSSNGCDLSEVIIGSGVVSIGFAAFAWNENLEKILFKGNAPSIGYSCFSGSEADAYYPKSDRTWTSGFFSGNYGGTLNWHTWDTVTVPNFDINDASVTLSCTSYDYDGSPKKPDVTLTDRRRELIEGLDYHVNYLDNTNAGTGKVEITGMNKYENVRTVNFTINKIDQGVTASISSPNLKTGETAQITASGVGTASYSSSASSVASVSTKGLVTAKSPGTAVITVTCAGNTNYRSATASVNVTVTQDSNAVSRPTLSSLTYSFSNSSSSFHYKEPYYIPLDRYLTFFDPYTAIVYKSILDGQSSWNGNCFGFSTTATMFNVPTSTLKLSYFGSSVSKVSDLKYNTKSSTIGMDTTALLENMLVSQYTDKMQSRISSNKNKVNNLLNEVKKCDNGSPAVIICIANEVYGGGHAICGYRVEQKNANTVYLHVYDCNYPAKDKYMVFKTDSSGKATGAWSYDNYYSNALGHITYVTYSDAESVWKNRNSSSKLAVSSMTINSNNFDLKDSRGAVIAQMRDGDFYSTRDDIYEATFFDVECDSHILYMPTDQYRVVAADSRELGNLEVSMMNGEQCITVKTEASAVELLASEAQGLGLAGVNGYDGEHYTVTLGSSTEYYTDREQIVYSGICEGDAMAMGSYYGELFSKSYTRSGAFIVEDAFNTGESDLATESIEGSIIELDSYYYDYTGEEIIPNASVITNVGNGKTLSEGNDYTLVYTGNISAGKAKITAYGIGDYKGSISTTFTIRGTSLSADDVSVSNTTFDYTGGLIEPAVTVKHDSAALVKDKDYYVVYTDNLDPGTAKATVIGLGVYYGSVDVEFTIRATSVPVEKVTLNRDSATVVIGKTVSLTATVSPADASDKRVTWISYDTSVAQVSSDGVVTGTAEGTTLVAAQSSNGKIATCTVTVSDGSVKLLLGDVDGDGTVTIIDATCIQMHLAGIPLPFILDINVADAYPDGSADVLDVTEIQRSLADLPANNNIGKPMG